MPADGTKLASSCRVWQIAQGARLRHRRLVAGPRLVLRVCGLREAERVVVIGKAGG